MDNFVKLDPLIYRVLKGEKNFNLKVIGEKYDVKKKLYGNVHKLIYRIKRLIELNLYSSISVIASGKAGMGKTTSLNFLCNMLLENKIPIIEVKFIDVNTELIEFLSNFRKSVIYIDEFGKIFAHGDQDKALTLLNKHNGNENIFLLGENDLYKISRFILDRMERVKYHLTHDRVSKDDMKAYCDDNNLDGSIYSSLAKINEKASVISYDTLEIISEEHKLFPELDFEELTSIMNCQSIIGIPVIGILDITIESDTYYVSSYELSEWSKKIKDTDFIDGKSNVNIQVQIDKFVVEDKKEDDKPKSETKPDFNLFKPTFNGTSSMNNLLVKSSHITKIDDIDNTIYIEVNIPYAGQQLKASIIFGTKLVSVNS